MRSDDYYSENILDALREIERTLERIEKVNERPGGIASGVAGVLGALDPLREIERTLDRIEATVKQHPVQDGFSQLIGSLPWYFFWVCIYFLIGSAWHSKWRYAAQYQVIPSKVTVAKEPHDCDFWYAPIGDKFCEYGRRLSTVRWGRSSTSGQPIFSTDEGKTWDAFTPDTGIAVPSISTVEGVSVDWEKKEK
jgi:hypothetical protein